MALRALVWRDVFLGAVAGCIPKEFGRLRALTLLDLGSNKLYGKASESIEWIEFRVHFSSPLLPRPRIVFAA